MENAILRTLSDVPETGKEASCYDRQACSFPAVVKKAWLELGKADLPCLLGPGSFVRRILQLTKTDEWGVRFGN